MNIPPRFVALCTQRLFLLLLLIVSGRGLPSAKAATNKSPKLISHATSTRAIALESVTLRAEPFALTASVPFSADTRTRICIFAMDLELLPGEGKNAFTSDVQDASGRIYPLNVEYVGQVPNFPGITMIVVRLHDELGDVGDVLLRLNLHGMSSNRVRIAIGHAGGGPPDDVGAVATPAPQTPPPADPPLVPDPFTGPASEADAVRFLQQATWGPTLADINHVKNVGFLAYLNQQFNAPVTNPSKGSNYSDLAFPAEDGTACPTSSPGDPNYNQAVCNRDNFSMYPVQRTFFSNALYGSDQLRQRVAFGLHQILVVSAASQVNRPSWMTIYLQAIDRNALGNYRTLLQEITLTPAMGEFLDMRASTRTNPNENFAREILQLFSIGTDLLNPDGTPQRDAQGVPIPAYTQTHVDEFTRVFTGWNFAQADMNAWELSANLSELSSNHTVIIFDSRGVGNTTTGNRPFSIQQFANDTAGLLDALQIQKADVLGYSLGSFIAQQLAVTHPDKVNRLVLVAASCGGKESIPPSPELPKMVIDVINKIANDTPVTSQEVKALMSQGLGSGWLKLHPNFLETMPIPEAKDLFPSITPNNNLKQLKAVADWMATNWNGVCDELRKISIPTLIITGTDDTNVPTQNSLIIAEKNPGAWLIQIKDAGHQLPGQYPDKINKIIQTFLSTTGQDR
jgi:pimeloyl-ACP methyl ester carboxylesterase